MNCISNKLNKHCFVAGPTGKLVVSRASQLFKKKTRSKTVFMSCTSNIFRISHD